MSKMKFEAGEQGPENAKAIMAISEKVSVLLDMIRSLFREDTMEVTLILRAKIPCESGTCEHDGAHGAAFIEQGADIEKQVALLRRMGKNSAKVVANQPVDEGLVILSEREGDLN